MPSVFRKLSETLQRVPKKAQRFHGSSIPVWIYDGKPTQTLTLGIAVAVASMCQIPSLERIIQMLRG